MGKVRKVAGAPLKALGMTLAGIGTLLGSFVGIGTLVFAPRFFLFAVVGAVVLVAVGLGIGLTGAMIAGDDV